MQPTFNVHITWSSLYLRSCIAQRHVTSATCFAGLACSCFALHEISRGPALREPRSGTWPSGLLPGQTTATNLRGRSRGHRARRPERCPGKTSRRPRRSRTANTKRYKMCLRLSSNEYVVYNAATLPLCMCARGEGSCAGPADGRGGRRQRRRRRAGPRTPARG